MKYTTTYSLRISVRLKTHGFMGTYLGHSLFRNKEEEMTTGPGAVPRLGDPVAHQHQSVTRYVRLEVMLKCAKTLFQFLPHK